jgi:hypothetical protein
MKVSAIWAGAALSVMSVWAGHARAATITQIFSFLDAGNNTIASGSFSYDSSESGVLGFPDLSAFSLTENIDGSGTTYDLAYVDTLTPGADDVYFGYDTVANLFVPGIASDSFGGLSSILAAAQLNQTSGVAEAGFLVEPLLGQDDPDGTGALGFFSVFPGSRFAQAGSFEISPVPEPSSWVLMLTGVAIMGGALRYSRATGSTAVRV